MKNLTQEQQDYVLDFYLPYCVDCVDAAKAAIDLRATCEGTERVSVLVDDKLRLTGKFTAITNPMIEAGVIRARSVIEFLGIGFEKGALVTKTKRNRKPDDIGIENLVKCDGTHLNTIKIEDALLRYNGKKIDAENAFIWFLHRSNKNLAHITHNIFQHAPEYTAEIRKEISDDDMLRITFAGIRPLLINFVYRPLGREIKNSAVTSE